MGICQDCAKNDAKFIIFDVDKNSSFLVCKDCINEEDLVADQTIKDIINFEQG